MHGFLWNVPASTACRHPWFFLCQCVLCMKGSIPVPRRSCHGYGMCPTLFTQLAILAVTKRVMPGLPFWRSLADHIYLAVLGGAGCCRCVSGIILFTGQNPNPFWALAIVSVGDLGQCCVESQLLACSSVMKGETCLRLLRLLDPIPLEFAGCRPESSWRWHALPVCLLRPPSHPALRCARRPQSLFFVATGAGHEVGGCLATPSSKECLLFGTN